MCIVYCFTNLINGKKYIGSTILTAEERYKQHINNSKNKNCRHYKYPLYNGIRKYGIENFSYEILVDKNCSEKEIRQIEHELIVKFNTLCPNGYNQTDNTEHPFQSDIVYKKMGETKREKHYQFAEIDKNGNILHIWRCMADAIEEDGSISENHASSVCLGYRLSTNGRIFRYIDKNGHIIEPEYKGNKYYKGLEGTTQVAKHSKSVVKIDLESNKVLEIYSTIALASRENKTDASLISACCKGKRYSTNGFRYMYNENYNIGDITPNIYDLIETKKSVYQYDKEGNFIAEYPSLGAAEIATGASRSNISRVCEKRKGYKTAKGFIWRFKNEQ